MTGISEIKVKNIDHLGIVAGLIDEIGIVKIVNEKLGIDEREKITSGQIVKAILINGLGFVSRPLYLFSQFFEDKETETLLGKDINPSYINDDKIGRVMDKLYKSGLNNIFLEIVLAVIKKFKITIKYSHLDATSFHFHGEYNSEITKEKEEKLIKERPIIINKGYSRDHRPDLKQCVLDLITSQDGDLPLFMRVGDGNEADKAVFAKIILEFNKQINFSSIMVCDSALYSQENLQLMGEIKWITRVPMTIKKAQELVKTLEIKERELGEEGKNSDQKLEGYKWKEEIITYGGIKQIWLIVESEKRKSSDLKKIEQQIKKEEENLRKMLKQLKKEEFEQPEQARYKLKGMNKKLKYWQIEEIKIIKSLSKKSKTIYQIEVREKLEEQVIEIRKREAGRFILATNLIDEQKLKPAEIIRTYKNQQSCERGFRFLKDPLFFADSFFVENPERIETILFLMSLCLLVYNLGQRELRNNLKREKSGVKNQVGKETNNPTLRWIFQCFQGIHVLTYLGIKQIVNLTDEHRHILSFLPTSCQSYYFLSG